MGFNRSDDEILQCIGSVFMLQQQTISLLDAAKQIQAIANTTGDEQFIETANEFIETANEFAKNARKLAAISFGETE